MESNRNIEATEGDLFENDIAKRVLHEQNIQINFKAAITFYNKRKKSKEVRYKTKDIYLDFYKDIEGKE